MIPRMRGMRAAYFQDGDLYDLEDATKLPLRTALLGLECWTDREGRFEWAPRTLKLNILPFDTLEFAAVLDALAKGNFVQRYDVGGKSYGVINPEFWKQQNINKNEAQSELPPPPADVLARFQQGALAQGFHSYRDEPSSATVRGSSDSRTDTHMQESAASLEVNRREGKGIEEGQQQGEGAAVSSTVPEAAGPIEPGRALVLTGDNGDRPAVKKAQPLPAIQGRRTYDAIRSRLAIVAAEIAEGTRDRLRKADLRVIQAEMVFGYWQAKTGHTKAYFDDKRERYIVKRLEESDGDVSECLFAIDGSLRDKNLQGDNDRGRKFDGISTIFRDREQVERLAGVIKKHRDGEAHDMVVKYAQALNAGAEKNA